MANKQYQYAPLQGESAKGYKKLEGLSEDAPVGAVLNSVGDQEDLKNLLSDVYALKLEVAGGGVRKNSGRRGGGQGR